MGEEPIPGPGREIIACTNPDTGITYGAIHDPTLDALEATPAVRMVHRCQQEVDEYLPVIEFCDAEEPGFEVERDICYAQRNDVNDIFEKLDLMRSIFHYTEYNIR
jgi:hypothetical protein